MKLLLLILGLAWLSTGTALGFVVHRSQDRSNGRWYPIRWGRDTETLQFHLNDRPMQLLPNLASDARLADAIEAAMRTWSFAPVGMRLAGTSPAEGVERDGINLISFADTPANRELCDSCLSNGARWWSRTGSQSFWRLAEVDLVFQPDVRFASDGRPTAVDLQGILTRQLGYALGLGNSRVASSVMWPYSTEGETRTRTLDPDDIAAVRAAFGITRDRDLGTLAGSVMTTAREPFFGGHVVAADASGVVRGSTLTERDGSFSMPLLPPSSYTVHVEPMNVTLEAADFSNGYYREARRDFLATFYGGHLPKSIRVDAGETTTLDPMRIVVQPPRLNIQSLGLSVYSTDEPVLGTPAVMAKAGSYSILHIVGQGLKPGTAVSISGPDVIIYRENMTSRTLPNRLTALTVPIVVENGAAPGGRTLYVSRDGEMAAFPGGLKITGP